METEMLGDNAIVVIASDRHSRAMMEGINSKMAEAIGRTRNHRTDSIQEALQRCIR